MNERERIEALEARVLALELRQNQATYLGDPEKPDGPIYATWPHKIPQDFQWWAKHPTTGDPPPLAEYQVTSQVRG